jgi:hypothetical protein
MKSVQNPDTNPAGDGEEISVTAASQGQKTGHIRWVLIVGTVLAVVGLITVWMVVQTHH